jgi:hypothetical protein
MCQANGNVIWDTGNRHSYTIPASRTAGVNDGEDAHDCILEYSQPDLSKLAFFRLCPSASTHAKVPTALNFVIPTGADQDFLYRGAVHGDVCGSPLGKPHEIRQRH